MTSKKYGDVNYYELLGIDFEAEQSSIRKAYRKKALECHPDKNPDNPKAAELFHELSRALEILTDSGAKEAYDKILRAKKAAELRNKQLDSKRQKLKADLELRERDAIHRQDSSRQYSTVPKTDEQLLKEQIERLRREGSKLLEEEQRLMQEKLRQAYEEQKSTLEAKANKFDSSKHRIKIKWKSDKKDPTNGGYTQDKLLAFLKKYGDIEGFVMSKKPGSAMVEFKSFEACEMALKYEKGLMENPLSLEWVQPPQSKPNNPSSLSSSSDFEDLVMRKLRQAEERQRLIEQLKREEAEEDEKT